MMSLLGRGLVLAGLAACAAGAPLAFTAGARRSLAGVKAARRLAHLFSLAMVLATATMIIALIRHDFSVSYVAEVGSRSTPLVITIVSLWSSLAGSILLWGLILALYTTIYCLTDRRSPVAEEGYTLGTLLSVGLFFCFLISGPANPFGTTPSPIPLDGPGPNPLLQNHPLMIIHPPTLYLGYVGMAVPFAIALAALLAGRMPSERLHSLRTWLLVPCGFLSLGIMLGGWWSYEVLGWGGYWAWDPVENASFLPWLTGIAALHSALAQQRRGTLKAWTIILVMVSFLLTILGTFLTRSGVVNSVHAFSQSAIGPTILAFLGLCLVAVVVILSLRVDRLQSAPASERLTSRSGAILLNNLVLVAFTFTVLIGTLFPIVAEAVRGVKVSVGEPYFNRMAIPLGFGLLFLLGVGPALPWGASEPGRVRKALLAPLPAALVGMILMAWLGQPSFNLLLTGALGGYALWVTFDQALRPARGGSKGQRGDARRGFSLAAVVRSPRRLGAYVVHLGVIVTFIAIAVSSTFQTDAEATLPAGGTMEIGKYQLRFETIRVVEEPHLTAQRAQITVLRRPSGGEPAEGKRLGTLEPALNVYQTRREPLAAPAVRSSLTHDLYLTLMNVGFDGTVGIRAILTPAVIWIWIGVLMMSLGTVLCLLPSPQARAALARSVVDTVEETESEGAA